MPGTDALHSALIGTNVHVAHRFTYADAAAREAATPTASDVGCLALQEDNHSLWLLVDDDPLTWQQVGTGAGGITYDEVIGFTIHGAGGGVIAPGLKGYLPIGKDCTIVANRIVGDTAGGAVVDIWASSYADFPPTDADSITAAAPPTLTGAQKSEDITLTGWTTALTAGDWLAFNVDSAASVNWLAVALFVEYS